MSKPYDPATVVAITGMGIVSTFGQGIAAFQCALEEGQSNFKRSQYYPTLSFPVICAEVSEFNFIQALQKFSTFPEDRQRFLTKLSRHAPRTLQCSLIAALEAWQQARLDEVPVNMTKMGIIVTGQNNARQYQYESQLVFQQEPDYLSPTYALHFMDTDHVGTLSEVFGILGDGFTVGGASASGNVALLRAYQLIHYGLQEACLVVGALAELSPLELQGFYNLGAMGGHHFADTPEKACRPFDVAHEGFIYGQAAGCLILESLASAQQREVPVLGYVLGGAAVLDGNSLSNPTAYGEIRAMQQALQVSGITKEKIDYISTHGTSSPLGDQTEVEAIHAVLGERSREVLLNSTKSLTGHCLWSAGVIEAIATIIQMQQEFIHPTLNLDNPIVETCSFVGKKSESYKIQAALSNSFGFGGINTSLVLSRAE